MTQSDQQYERTSMVYDKLLDISEELSREGVTDSEMARAMALFLVEVSMAIDNDSYSSTDYTMKLIESAIAKVREDQPSDLILRTLPLHRREVNG